MKKIHGKNNLDIKLKKKSSGFFKEFYQKQSTQETDLTIT